LKIDKRQSAEIVYPDCGDLVPLPKQRSLVLPNEAFNWEFQS
jgi:hypothetical protein